MSKAPTIESVADVGAGAMLADKYRIIRVLGQGGMGVVVEAEHVRLKERVAIKFVSLAALANRDTRERFEREARATIRIRSEHAVRVRDIGELSNGQPYIVMELLEGCDLATLLDRETLDAGTIIDLVLQTCEVLAEAHALGIVHRDIKPANLFVTVDRDGRKHVKILDFGVATAPADDVQITGTGVVIGTPAYMCPEQMRSSRAAEPNWDLWALGAVMFQMFEGSAPFVGESYADLAVAVLTESPRPMVRTPVALRPIILRCLDKVAAARFAEASELAAALAPHASSQAHAAIVTSRIARVAGMPPPSDSDLALRPTTPQIADVPAASPSSIMTLPSSVPPETASIGVRRRPLVIALVLAIVAVVGVAIKLVVSREEAVASVERDSGDVVVATPDANTLVPDAGELVTADTVDAGVVDAIEAASTLDAAPPSLVETKIGRGTGNHRNVDAGAVPERPVIDAPIAVPAPLDARPNEETLMKGRN